jgi:hypothetical protein
MHWCNQRMKSTGNVSKTSSEQITAIMGDQVSERNRLKGQLGDGLNAVLCGAGYNFMKLIKALKALMFCCFVLFPLKVLRHLCLALSLSVV